MTGMKGLGTDWEVGAISLGDKHLSAEGHCVVSKNQSVFRLDVLTWEMNNIHAHHFHNNITENKANKSYTDQ